MATGLGMALPGIEYDEICRVTQAPTTFLAVSWVFYFALGK